MSKCYTTELKRSLDRIAQIKEECRSNIRTEVLDAGLRLSGLARTGIAAEIPRLIDEINAADEDNAFVLRIHIHLTEQ